MISEDKRNRILRLYNLFKDTGEDAFPFIESNLGSGLKIYFKEPPTYLLFIITDIVNQPVYVGVND